MAAKKKQALERYRQKFGKLPSGFSDQDIKPTLSAEEGARLLSQLVREREAKEAAGGAAASPQSEPAAVSSGGDYFREVAKTARELGCRKTEAQRIVNREQPNLWRDMLRKANPHKNDEELFK